MPINLINIGAREALSIQCLQITLGRQEIPNFKNRGMTDFPPETERVSPATSSFNMLGACA